MLRKRRFLIGLAVAALIGALFSLAFSLDLLYTLQRQSNDFFFQAANFSPKAEPNDKVIIIGIDNKSLTQLGRISSWSRSHYAQVIDKLSEAKARVIVFDILFAEPASGDVELANSIRNAGNVVLPVIFAPKMTDSPILRQTAEMYDFIRPLDVFAREATTLGHANITPDKDGVVRRLAMVTGSGDSSEPALALAAVAKYLRRPAVIESPVKNSALPFAGRLIPLSGNQEMLLNYIADPQGTGRIVNFSTVSFIEVLAGEVSPNLFLDKIVLIGVVASGLGDTFWTPMGLMLNGVEVHASAIHTILTANFLKQPPTTITVVLILVFALVTGLLVVRLRVLFAVLLTIFILLAYLLIAFSLFDRGIILSLFYPPLTAIATFAGVTLDNVIAERSEKRKITETIGRYLSPAVVDKILATIAEGELELGGEVQEVTVAFADARGFTHVSEKMPPNELVRVLNTYLSVVIQAVLKYEGMINKFGGDSVMAVWNAPVACQNHALFAIKAALTAQSAINGIAEQEPGMPRMEFGIGINTGKALAGNMGSQDRLEYTVIGDVVNTAARFADTAPGGKVWIGVDTLAQVQEHVEVRPLAPVLVKGKDKPIQVYEVVKLLE